MTDSASRNKLIEAITAPLGFFVLALLIVEASLSVILVLSDLQPRDKAIGMYLVVGMFVLVSTLVFLLVWNKPRNLTFDKAAHLDSERTNATYNQINRINHNERTMGYKESAVKDVESLKSNIRSHSDNIAALSSKKKEALVVVDIQNDFFSGGALPVPQAEALIEPLNSALRTAEKSDFLIVLTQDWHPLDHSSFEENGGDWKPHCIKGTNGAALHPDLYLPSNARIVRFGAEAELDGYSPYENPLMDQLINNQEVDRVYVVGIALEYCVFATCKQTRERNIEVIAVDSLIRAASPDKADETWTKLDNLMIKRQPELPNQSIQNS